MRTATPMPGGTRKNFLHNPPISLSISLLWLPCMFLVWFCWLQCLPLTEMMDVSSWNFWDLFLGFVCNFTAAKITFTSIQFLKCRSHFEDSVEMERLKSHLRAERHKCQPYFRYSWMCAFCLLQLVIVLPMLSSPSSAHLLRSLSRAITCNTCHGRVQWMLQVSQFIITYLPSVYL